MVMRRIVLLLLVMMAAVSVQAQKEEEGKWSLIPFVGINSSNMSGCDALSDDGGKVKAKGKIGLTAGLAAEYRYMQPLSTMLGVSYSRGGYRYTEQVRMRAHLDFLNLTALENLYIADGLALKTGIQVDYLLGGKYKYDNGSEELGRSFKRWNAVIPVGISYEYQHFMLDFRYNFGLTDLCNLPLAHDAWRSKSFVLSLGYRLHLN